MITIMSMKRWSMIMMNGEEDDFNDDSGEEEDGQKVTDDEDDGTREHSEWKNDEMEQLEKEYLHHQELPYGTKFLSLGSYFRSHSQVQIGYHRNQSSLPSVKQMRQLK